MSNTVGIQPTIFEDLPNGEKSYGFRIYDDYDCDYNNLWNWEDLGLAPLELLKKVRREASERTQALLDFVVQDQRGIYLAGIWYTWEEISETLEEELP
jgi:hypothetical protein